MAKIVRKGLIGIEDLNIGTGTYSRSTSTGGTQTMTKISLSAIGVFAVTSVSSTPYSAVITDGYILVDASGSAITVNLPTAIGNTGKALVIKKIDLTANVVTLDGSGSQTIDQSLTWLLTIPNEAIRIISDGSNWQIV